MKRKKKGGGIKYRPDIDGLRAIAVLSVVIFHAFPSRLPGGFAGVDVFFVISGFIITSIILERLDQGTFTLADFYVRRANRIFPALTFVLLSCIVFAFFFLFSDEYAQLGAHVFWSALFFQNINLLSEIGYLDKDAALKPLLHIWSLSVEEQFYFIWPLLLVIATKFKLSLIKFTLTLLSASIALNLFLNYRSPEVAFFLLFSRFWELLIGCLAAYIIHKKLVLKDYFKHLSLFGLILIFASFLIQKNEYIPSLQALASTVGAVLVLLGSRRAITNRILSVKPLVWIGLISYPLYLWHWPLLSFSRIAYADGTPSEIPASLRLVMVAISFLLAYLTYKFLESPIRFTYRNSGIFSLNLNVRAIFLTFFLLVICCAGYYVHNSSGLLERIKIKPTHGMVLFDPYPHAFDNENCRMKFPELAGSWSCLLSKDRAPDVLIIGDSHAHQYFSAFAEKLPELSVMNWSDPSCFPFSYKNTKRCLESRRQLINFIERQNSLKSILIMGYFSYLEGGFRYGNIEGKRVAPEKPPSDKQALFVASANELLGSLANFDKQVYLLKDIPDMIFNPRACVSFNNFLIKFTRGWGTHKPLDQCGINYSDFIQRNKIYDQSLELILKGFPKVKVFDPRYIFCRDNYCAAYKDNNFYYYNSDHLTLEGSRKVTEQFLKSNLEFFQ